MKILILGCTGTMGLPLSEELVKDKQVVYGLCRNTKIKVEGVNYIFGDFGDENVRNKIKEIYWDVIIDFLWHNDKKFKSTFAFLSSCTKHYIYLSSAAVYADKGKELISETDSRFYDINKSEESLYHLQKARMEDVIYQDSYKDWTIIRPHVTFNNNHIPLDIWPETVWMYRFLQGHKIVLTQKMLSYRTSYTCGREVAKLIKLAIYNDQPLSQVYNVASEHFYTWGELITIVSDCLKEITGKNLSMIILSPGARGSKVIELLPHMAERLIYDRLLDRTIDTSKIRALEDINYSGSLKEDLRSCLCKLIESTDTEKIRYNDATAIAYMDWISKEKTSLKYFLGKQKYKYLFLRYFIRYDIAVKTYYLLKKLKDKVLKR